MLLLGEVLAPLAPFDEFFGVVLSRGPIESSSEGLADQRARGCVVATDAFVDLLQDVLAFLSGNALHEYSGSCALPVELVFDEDVGLGAADELLGQVLVQENLLLAEVVNEGLPPVHVDHHDLLASRGMRWDSGRWRRLRDGWRVKLVDEDTRWYLSVSRTKLRQDIRCNVVVADDVVELETVELVLELADF
jgi:hypothetical protein